MQLQLGGNNPRNEPARNEPLGLRTEVLLLALVLALASNIFLLSRLSSLKKEAAVRDQQLREQIASIHHASLEAARNTERSLAEIHAALGDATTQAARKASSEARRESSRSLRTLAQKHREQQEYLVGEMQGVRSESGATRRQVHQIGGELNGVRGDLRLTRAALSSTESALTAAHGDLDRLHGQVGENANRIVELRRINERRFIAFELSRADGVQRIGNDVHLKLKKTDPKRYRYSVEVMADDVKFVEKDRYINQPVEFYVTGIQRPYELVITAVNNNSIAGYIAKPAMELAASR